MSNHRFHVFDFVAFCYRVGIVAPPPSPPSPPPQLHPPPPPRPLPHKFNQRMKVLRFFVVADNVFTSNIMTILKTRT